MRASLRPNVVENGTDLVLYHFLGNVERPFAFDPAGNVYTLTRYGVLKIAPDGTNSFVSGAYNASSSGDIVYAAGFLWAAAYQGVERFRPDGSDGRYFQFSNQSGLRNRTALTPGPDGVYFSFGVSSFESNQTTISIARLSAVKPAVTIFPIATVNGGNFGSDASLVMGADQHIYFDSTYGGHGESLGRLEADGTVTYFKGTNACGRAYKMVAGLGALYFIGVSSGYPPTARLCRATYSGLYTALSPASTSFIRDAIAADNNGDIWTVDLLGMGLYSYNLPTAKVTGPFLSGLSLTSDFLQTGPDQNIWFFTGNALNQIFLGAYVRHEMSFAPTSISLSAVDPSYDFFVTEPVPAGRFTAVSANPAVATVSPASSPVGRFTVTEVGHGTTSIAVTDAYGNVSYEPVTAN